MFTHNINPVIFTLFNIDIYYYGLAYSLGFLGFYLWLRYQKGQLKLNNSQVLDLVLLTSGSVLFFARAFEIIFYEWDHYSTNPGDILKYWEGGMASHGVLIGAVVGVFLFSKIHKRSFLEIADASVIPAALFLALGRMGNFINGKIVGIETDAWWGVKFPDHEGSRHPVTLYESLKNFSLIPILLYVKRKYIGQKGILLAHFIFWYGFLRIFTDIYRNYPMTFSGFRGGQNFNIFMSILGAVLIIYLKTGSNMKKSTSTSRSYKSSQKSSGKIMAVKMALYVFILIFSLSIASS